jgi:hypothetical protein
VQIAAHSSSADPARWFLVGGHSNLAHHQVVADQQRIRTGAASPSL